MFASHKTQLTDSLLRQIFFINQFFHKNNINSFSFSPFDCSEKFYYGIDSSVRHCQIFLILGIVVSLRFVICGKEKVHFIHSFLIRDILRDYIFLWSSYKIVFQVVRMVDFSVFFFLFCLIFFLLQIYIFLQLLPNLFRLEFEWGKKSKITFFKVCCLTDSGG